ncbi:PREDICTED: coiled-coil domain-containing protein 136 isoform X3 [Ceratosolen solmsi marchali]|uniref:Coiled-coil domain-containing protein 136 isoform X3 n=1 Tax=Ceratosolen solmsi marchali TaxID=326594 RepID=A0AAJ6YTS2_9HYME|nr:PREDICTED: coiled-coil domain-containing protein 136 isoform X3 [Ceratosolen solmsi marchali]
MNMSKKLSNSRGTSDCRFPTQPRKNKKLNNRKNNLTNEFRSSSNRNSHDQSEEEVFGMECQSMFWQQPSTSRQVYHSAHNMQRLFTAISDPSVCGYSAVPATYTMEPVPLPPLYRIQEPVIKAQYRPYRGKTRASLMSMQHRPAWSFDAFGNDYMSLQKKGWSHSSPVGYQNGDYASLPPTANIDNKNNREELSAEHRRYSDPGLGPADPPTTSRSDETDSADSDSSITTIGKSNKLYLTLIEQITKMKEMNSQLFKELHQAKSDLETVKTELNQFKKNIPSDYQPGMLSDIIKEIRDASRIKEEVMLSKLKVLMDSQQSQKFIDLEQLKSQLEKVRREKDESVERIGKLETEVAALRLSLNSSENREIAAFEEENLTLRRELQEARASRNMAECHATKLERLMEILREKTHAAGSTSTRNEQKAVAEEEDDDENDDEEEDEDEIDVENKEEGEPRRDESEKSSKLESNPTIASGPVTDL